MRCYNFDEIKQRANCLSIARDLGLAVDSQGRCAATWRGGDNKTAVSINKDGWNDFVSGNKGSVIDLVAAVMFGGSIQSAQEWLGERLNLTAKHDTSKVKPRTAPDTTQEKQIDTVYDYVNLQGELVFQVVRLTPKGFSQRSPDGKGGFVWTTKGIEKVLYRLPRVSEAIQNNKPVFIVEGEKDVHALESLGLVATCNPGGAGKWHTDYTRSLTGANIVIIADRDEPGREHSKIVSNALLPVCKSVKVLELPDRNGKAVKDAADWITAGGTLEELTEISTNAPEATQDAGAAEANTDTTGSPIDAAQAGKPYPMTDLGNAERLCAWFGDSIRWDVARKSWRVWDGRRWDIDSALRINALAADSARQIRMEAAAAPSGRDGLDMGQELFKHAIRSESRDRLAAAIEVSKARPGIAVSADQLDADPWVLNVLNGTIDLHAGTLRPHNRAELLTKLAPVEFNPNCTCERWERFLADATGNDAEVISFLQIGAGYTLTGDTSEEKLFIIYGPHASGKTTVLEALKSVLGEYARTIQADLLTRQRESRGGGAASPELAGLAGSRLAAGSEMEQGREIAEALAKNLTGGESITARHLYAELFDFRPQFKLWLALNHCPKVSADDGAIWRRILRIGFENTVPQERRDKTLKPYLCNPNGGAPAVLAWAVKGCLRWQREGLTVPAAVVQSTAAYRQESDPLAAFVEDCLCFNANAWTQWSDLWRAYNEHAAECGTAERYRVAPKRLQERLRGNDCESERRYTGRGWRGVELHKDWNAGDHVAHVVYDTIPKTFSSNPPCRKGLQSAVMSDMTDMEPSELDFLELG